MKQWNINVGLNDLDAWKTYEEDRDYEYYTYFKHIPNNPEVDRTFETFFPNEPCIYITKQHEGEKNGKKGKYAHRSERSLGLVIRRPRGSKNANGNSK